MGGKKRAAQREATTESQNRHADVPKKVTDVFEHSKYESLSRTWKFQGLYLCSDPTTRAPELFDPALQATIPGTSWVIDFSLAGIDAEGWTYAYDFAYLNKHGAGESSAKWNTYVRRRKWKFTDSSATGKNSEALKGVQDRAAQRVVASAAKAGSSQAEKIGYKPRSRQTGLTASGLTSTFKKGGDEDELDEDSKAGLAKLKDNDAEIDAGLDEISHSLDNLANIAGAMNEETKSQNKKLDTLNSAMDRAADKQALVNARLKRQLR